jgi:hypothetical protein
LTGIGRFERNHADAISSKIGVVSLMSNSSAFRGLTGAAAGSAMTGTLGANSSSAWTGASAGAFPISPC